MKSRILILLCVVIMTAMVVAAVGADTERIVDNSKELFKQVQLFADSITIISEDYVKPIKVKDLVYGAIKGMMNTLDGYSQFMDPEDFKEITEETKGQFGGIGVEIGMRDSVLTVIAPIDGTPAFSAGIQAGDMVVKINDEITRNMTLDEAVKKMRGDPGTEIKITVLREDIDKVLDFTVTRAIIKLKSIKEARIITDEIGYIKLIEFQEPTAKDLAKTIIKLRDEEGARSLVMDLRNNPGGLLDATVEVADLFLDEGTMIVYTEGCDPGSRMEFKAKHAAEFKKMDLIVLVNKGSASAAEIFAGAIKDNNRGLIVGVPTFGKGSVQTVIPLRDKSALKLTTAAYFTPAGKNLMDKGIIPDVRVKRLIVEEPKKDNSADEVFDKVEDNEITPSGEKEEVNEKDDDSWKYDNQITAAVNILKGVRILSGHKEIQPDKKIKVEQKEQNINGKKNGAESVQKAVEAEG